MFYLSPAYVLVSLILTAMTEVDGVQRGSGGL